MRLHYVYPYPHVRELIPLMAEGLILPYLDIPFQHCHPDVLRRMARPAAGARTLDEIARWRADCPEIVLRSTFIVGYPGETEAEFQHLLDWLDAAQLDRVGCFRTRTSTAPAPTRCPTTSPSAVKEERWERFMAKAQAISAAKLAARVGTRIEVIVDEVDAEAATCRTRGDAPEIDGNLFIDEGFAHLRPGDIADRDGRGGRRLRPLGLALTPVRYFRNLALIWLGKRDTLCYHRLYRRLTAPSGGPRRHARAAPTSASPPRSSASWRRPRGAAAAGVFAIDRGGCRLVAANPALRRARARRRDAALLPPAGHSPDAGAHRSRRALGLAAAFAAVAPIVPPGAAAAGFLARRRPRARARLTPALARAPRRRRRARRAAPRPRRAAAAGRPPPARAPLARRRSGRAPPRSAWSRRRCAAGAAGGRPG